MFRVNSYLFLLVICTPGYSFAENCSEKIGKYVYSLAYTIEHGQYVSQDRIDYVESEILRVRELQRTKGSCEALKNISYYVQDTSTTDAQNKEIEKLREFSVRKPTPGKAKKYSRSYAW